MNADHAVDPGCYVGCSNLTPESFDLLSPGVKLTWPTWQCSSPTFGEDYSKTLY